MGRKDKITIESKIKELYIIIYTKKISFWPILILTLLSLFCFSFPIYIMLLDEVSIGFGFIFTIFIFMGSGVYFLRKLLWSTLGKEVYQITENTLTYYYYYWVFNDNKQIISFTDLKFGYANSNEPYMINEFSANCPSDEDNLYFATFITNKIPIVSNIHLSLKDILKFKNAVKYF